MKAGTSGCTQTVPVCTCGRWVLEPGMGGRPMRADRRLGCLYWTRVRTGVYGLAIRARSTQPLAPGSTQPLGLSGLRGEEKKKKKKTRAWHKEQTKAQASLESGNEKTSLESGNKKKKKKQTKQNQTSTRMRLPVCWRTQIQFCQSECDVAVILSSSAVKLACYNVAKIFE